MRDDNPFGFILLCICLALLLIMSIAQDIQLDDVRKRIESLEDAARKKPAATERQEPRSED